MATIENPLPFLYCQKAILTTYGATELFLFQENEASASISHSEAKRRSKCFRRGETEECVSGPDNEPSMKCSLASGVRRIHLLPPDHRG